MNQQRTSIAIGSRGSQLALWQADNVKNSLRKIFPKLTITNTTISTTGDSILDSPLAEIGDKGLFTKEIDRALLDHQIDIAVHSLKDVPTMLPDGLMIGAITSREDVRDVFISHPKKNCQCIDDIKRGGIIATGSLRRTSQLLHWRPDLRIENLRGNLNTRFAKLDASHWDGMILARAGVVRLGLEQRITEIISTDKILPAVGQGALAIVCRKDDTDTLDILRQIASTATTISTCSERALLRHLEGGCQVPIGAYGRIENNLLYLDALVGSLDGKNIVRGKIHGNPDQAEELGIQLAKTLLKGGGGEILANIRNTTSA